MKSGFTNKNIRGATVTHVFMKSYTVETVHNSIFLIHEWISKPDIVCGCFPNGERANMRLSQFKEIDSEKVNEIHEKNYNKNAK